MDTQWGDDLVRALEPGLTACKVPVPGPALLMAPYLAVTAAVLQTWAPVPPQLLNLWGMGGACPALHMLDLWDGRDTRNQAEVLG